MGLSSGCSSDYLIPVMVMPAMKRRRANRKAMTSGAVMIVAPTVV